jgi:hypothetical protein
VAVDEAAGVDFTEAAAVDFTAEAAERISAVVELTWAAAPISEGARAWAVELISEAALVSAVGAHVSVVRTSAAGLR